MTKTDMPTIVALGLVFTKLPLSMIMLNFETNKITVIIIFLK